MPTESIILMATGLSLVHGLVVEINLLIVVKVFALIAQKHCLLLAQLQKSYTYR